MPAVGLDPRRHDPCWSKRTHQLWQDYYSAPGGVNKGLLYDKYQRSANQGLLGTILNPVK